MSNYIMNRESLKRHCEATCKKFKDVPTSGIYGEHRLVLDLLEQTEWIPVSERLPEESGNYLVTYCYQDKIETQEAVYFEDEDKWFDITDIEISLAVIAWMPKPEPYEPQESEVEE